MRAPLRPSGVEILRVAAFVVGDDKRGRVGILRVVADERIQQDGRIGHGAAHRPGGILKDDQRRQARCG